MTTFSIFSLSFHLICKIYIASADSTGGSHPAHRGSPQISPQLPVCLPWRRKGHVSGWEPSWRSYRTSESLPADLKLITKGTRRCPCSGGAKQPAPSLFLLGVQPRYSLSLLFPSLFSFFLLSIKMIPSSLINDIGYVPVALDQRVTFVTRRLCFQKARGPKNMVHVCPL